VVIGGTFRKVTRDTQRGRPGALAEETLSGNERTSCDISNELAEVYEAVADDFNRFYENPGAVFGIAVCDN
jgi:hypothetical protein